MQRFIERRGQQPLPEEAFDFSGLRTTNGRFLTEPEERGSLGASPPYVLRHVPLPRDNRAFYPKYPYNVSAWDEVRSNRGSALHDLAWLNRELFPEMPDQGLTVSDVDTIAQIAAYIPVYLVNRVEEPIDPMRIPDHLGVLHKVAQGVRKTTDILDSNGMSDDILTPQKLYDVSNAVQSNGKPPLVGDTQQCPAPRGSIIEFSKALITREKGNPDESIFPTYFINGDFLNAVHFTIILAQLDQYIETHGTVSEAVREVASQETEADRKRELYTHLESMNSMLEDRVANDIVVLNSLLGRS